MFEMGNEKSKQPHGAEKEKSSHPSHDDNYDSPRAQHAFIHLAHSLDAKIPYKQFEALFGGDFAESLWEYLNPGGSRDIHMDYQTFSKKALSLISTSTDVYVLACQPVHHLIKCCSDAAEAGAVEGDEQFIVQLVKSMCESGSSVRDQVDWKHATCPRLCNALQNQVLLHFTGLSCFQMKISSNVLSPLQLWFVQSCLPAIYFPAEANASSAKDNNAGQWTPLFSSASQGKSVSRFEANVFDYKGPTVVILQLTDKRTFVIATENTWRHSGTRFGGPATMLLQIEPFIKKIEATNSIYCNFKIRSSAMGLSFQEVLKIDKDMDCVLAAEVWGCAGANTLAEQQKLRQWQSNQAEKNKKVPLPGNWDDNPDKTLMEMAGFQFSNERQLMEMEAKAREDDKIRGL